MEIFFSTSQTTHLRQMLSKKGISDTIRMAASPAEIPIHHSQQYGLKQRVTGLWFTVIHPEIRHTHWKAKVRG